MGDTMDAFDQSGAKPVDQTQTPSKSVLDILTMLRSVADRGHSDNVTDLHSHRIDVGWRGANLRPIRGAVLDNKVVTTVTHACASASIVAVLQMLSNLFE